MKKLLCIAILLMLLLTACAPAAQAPATTAGTQPTTEPVPTVTEPPVTQPPTTQPPTTEPVLPPEPFVAHEKFSAESCAALMGIWSVKVRLDWRLQNLDQFTGYTEFMLYYSFDEDGYFEAYVDPIAFDKAIDNYEQLVIEHMLGLRYEAFRGPLEYQGVPEEKIREMWEGPEKEKAREEVTASVAALNLYHRFGMLTREGQYYVEGGKLYTQVDDETFESSAYSCTAKALTLRNTDRFTVYRPLCINFPFVLNYVNQDAAA